VARWSHRARQLSARNATKPPLGDPAAMADRHAWREQLERWAEGPRALLAAPQRHGAGIPGSRLRVLVRR